MIRLLILSLLFAGLAACSDSNGKRKGATATDADQQVSAQSLPNSMDYSFVVDDNLRACIELTGATQAQLHSFVCAGKQIKTLAGIEGLTELRNVNVSFNNINDLSPLAQLPKLEVVYATHNKITNVGDLAESKNLKELALTSNNIDDASDLYQLAKLKKVYLQKNPIESVDSEFAKSRVVAL